MIPAVSLARVGNGKALHDVTGPGKVRCGAKGAVVTVEQGLDHRVIRCAGKCVCQRCIDRREEQS